MQNRSLFVVELPSLLEIEVSNPENCLLVFNGTGISIDIGACCYRVRDFRKRKAHARFKTESIPVDLNTCRPRIANIIRKYIFECSSGYFSDYRPSTLAVMTQGLVNFFKWNDKDGPEFDFEKNEDFENILDSFRLYLLKLVYLGKLKKNTAAGYYQNIEKIFYVLLGERRENKKKYKLQFDSKDVVSTEPAAIDAQAKVMSLCFFLFDNLFDLVIGEKKFPYWLALPSSLNWPNNGMWIYPSRSWIVSPLKKNPSNCTFNYEVGDFYLPEDLPGYGLERFHKNKKHAERQIIKSNEDTRCSTRILLATVAHNAFLILFFAATGANLSVVSDIEIPDDICFDPASQGLRSIKFRARGKIIYLDIPLAMVPEFKKYIQLRSYILNGGDFRYLFLSLNSRDLMKPKKISQNFINTFYETLFRFDSELPKIKTKQWRASKADWLVRNSDVATAAQVLQNSEKTLKRHYIEGSAITQKNEIGDFFIFLSDKFLKENGNESNLESTPVGQCYNYGFPESISVETNSAVPPECKKFESCFGCVNHKVHADEVDVRKLLSCKFCINSIRHLSVNQAHFDEVFGMSLTIIDRIVNYISEISTEMSVLVKRVSSEVSNEGMLDPFWRSHYEMLIAIGVLNYEG